jgi:hypothetical protein
MMPLNGRCGVVAVVGETGGETVMTFYRFAIDVEEKKDRLGRNGELSESGLRGCHES